MKKIFLICVLLFAFANVQATYTITTVLESSCDSSGKGQFEVELTADSPITSPLEFTLTLNGTSAIQATCSIEIPTGKSDVESTDEALDSLKGSSQMLNDISDTIKETSVESQQSSDKESEAFESTLGTTNEIDQTSDETQKVTGESQQASDETREETGESQQASNSQNEVFESTLGKTDNTQKVTEVSQQSTDTQNEAFGSTSEKTDESQLNSDEATDKTLSSEILDQEETKNIASSEVQTPDSEVPKEIQTSINEEITSEVTDKAESSSEQTTDFVSDSLVVDETTKNSKSDVIDSTDMSSKTRILASTSADYYFASCTYEAPSNEGNYILIADSDSGVEVNEDLEIELIPCLNEEQAEQRANITLSFRQVNSFNAEDFSFTFYALSKELIEQIQFYIFFMIGFNRAPSPVLISCALNTPETGDGEQPVLYALSFLCQMPSGFQKGEYTSIEISSSDNVAGLPTNSTLLNPLFTDEAIDNGLTDVSILTYIPSLLDVSADELTFDEEKGTFTMEIPYTEETIQEKIGKTFEIPLAFPWGIILIGKIIKFSGGMLTIEFAIDGKIENQPLIWEQTIISIEGVEWFVLPGFKTIAVTTDGFNGTISEDIPSDQEGLSEGIVSDQEGESNETGSDAQISSDETSSDQSSDEQVASDEASSDKASDEQVASDEESSDKTSDEQLSSDETSSDKTSDEQVASDEATSDQTSDEKLSSDETSSDKASDAQVSSDETSSDKASDEQVSSDETSSDQTSDEQLSSDEKTSDQSSDAQETSDETSSDQSSDAQVSSDEASSDKTSDEQVSSDETSSDKTSDEQVSSDETSSSDKASDEQVSSDEETSDQSSDDQVSSDETSSDQSSSDQETSSDEVSSDQEKSSDETSSDEEESSDETQTDQEVTSSESSANQTSSEQATTQQVTTQQTTTQATTQQGETEEVTSSSINGTEGISIEEAEKKAEIFISFRQLGGFSLTGTVITFNFYALTSQSISQGNIIVLLVNLIGINGMDEEATKVECTLPSDVTLPSGAVSVQANYQCRLENVNATEGYTSLRLNSSNDITGIPTEDETLLNPVLTDQAIQNKEVKDCSKDASVPPTFNFDSIEQSTCSRDGKFTIKGSLSEEKSIAAKFTLPLTYPEGTSLTCTYEEESIQCLADKELEGNMIIEQTVITNGAEELFILSNITTDNMKCGNGLHIKASEKINVDISFRQVSHIELISNRFYFFFAAFVNANLPASYLIDMNVILTKGEETVERVATCTLNEAVTSSGEKTQGDFNCTVALESGEDIPVGNLTISTNNDKIGGCAELTKEEASPKATDDAISDSSNAESELGVVVDYYLESNKNTKPPSLTISAFDLSRCGNNGKIKVTGTLSQAIDEEMTFELPFSFPSSKVKCTIEPTNETQNVEMSCKIQKKKKIGGFKQFVVEPRLLKKKRKEMLFIESKSINLNQEYKCENFNELKLKRAKARKSSPFSFLQLGRPSGYGYFFFLALMKRSSSAMFTSTTFTITVVYSASSRMRALEETKEEDQILTCTVGETADNSGVFNCGDGKESIVPLKIDLIDDQVAGINDLVNVEKNPNPDLSQKGNLTLFNNLINVTITNLTSNNCSGNGSYIIQAEAESELNFTSKSNITVPFSTPDSKGLCVVNVKSDKKSITMYCENTDAFTVSEMIISDVVIYDEDDVTPLFKIKDDYTAPVQFACAISDKSLKVPFSPNYTDPNSVEPSGTGNARFFRNGSSGGLSGGAIAGIVVSCVAVVAIVGVLIALAKKGIFSGAASGTSTIDNTSSLNRLGYNSQTANMAV